MARTKLQKTRRELDRLNAQLRRMEQQKADLERERDEVADKLARIENHEIAWTDHGLLRYLERVRGEPFDSEALLAEVITDELQNLVRQLGGSGKFPCGQYTLVLRDHRIVTVLDPEGK